MDFLARHVEKLILGLALVGLLASCYYLLFCLNAAREDVRDVQDKSDRAVVEGKRIEPLRGFTSKNTLTDPAVSISVDGKDTGRSLLEPGKYIRCANPRCPYLLPFNLNDCPYCRAKQPPVDPRKVQEGEDADEDGIPDFTESKYSFLNPRDPTDVLRDSDGDGFTNIEEYRADPRTKLDDPTDYPPLAQNLRFLKVLQKPLPILLRGISKNNSDDAAKWDISCYVIQGGKQRSKLLRIGETVAEFELVQAEYKTEERVNPTTKLKRDVDVSELTIKQTEGGATYTLTTGQKGYEKDLIGSFFFLSNRYDPKRCYRFYGRVGSEIRLPHRPSRQIHHYEVLDIQENGIKIRRSDPDVEPKEFMIGKVNPRRDFLKKSDTGGTGGRDGGRDGMMGDPDVMDAGRGGRFR